jgi:hypothetical protein
VEKRAVALLRVLGWVGLVGSVLIAVLTVAYPTDGLTGWAATLAAAYAFVFWAFAGLFVWSVALTLSYIVRHIAVDRVPASE